MMKVLCVLVVCVALLCFAEVSAQENEEGNQFLNEVKLGNLNRAKTMLQEGKVSANYKRPSDGNTALHIAADASNLEMAKMVLSFGADTEIPNNDNWLPMHIAARENNSEFVHLLFRFK
jgi:ankyrin repeat protein